MRINPSRSDQDLKKGNSNRRTKRVRIRGKKYTMITAATKMLMTLRAVDTKKTIRSRFRMPRK